jgi:hypothetical protein
LAVYDDGGAHCYACGKHVHPKQYKPKGIAVVRETKAALPLDFTRDVPAGGWKWLLQYGLPYSYWKPYTGYSPAEDRLILTVGNPVQFSVGRYIGTSGNGSAVPLREQAGELLSVRQEQGQYPVVDGSRRSWREEAIRGNSSPQLPSVVRRSAPSYQGVLGQAVAGGAARKWKQYGERSGVVGFLEPADSRPAERVILVEDLISGHKVAQVAPSITLFGTDLYSRVIQKLVDLRLPVDLWLDEDQYGNLPPKLGKLLTFVNTPVRFIRKRKDPKEYSISEIKEIINE